MGVINLLHLEPEGLNSDMVSDVRNVSRKVMGDGIKNEFGNQ